MQDNLRGFGERKFYHKKAETAVYGKKLHTIICDNFNDNQSKGMCEVASYMQAITAAHI